VAWAAFFNFVAAFTFGTAVADTVGKGFVDLSIVTPYVVLAGVIGAIVWDLITWWLACRPVPRTLFIGGYAGATMARAAFLYGFSDSTMRLIIGQMPQTLASSCSRPMIGMFWPQHPCSYVYWVFKNRRPAKHTDHRREHDEGQGLGPLPMISPWMLSLKP